jgi:hypothetical protein
MDISKKWASFNKKTGPFFTLKRPIFSVFGGPAGFKSEGEFLSPIAQS